MNELQRILTFLEANLDPVHIKTVKTRLRKNLNFEKIAGRVPLRILFPGEEFQPFPYDQAFKEPAKMLYNELLPICNAVLIQDDTLPMIRANFGVGILPSVFGLTTRIINNDLPWVAHLNELDKIKKLMEYGVPDFKTGLGARVFATHEYYQEQLAKYPKCQQLISIYHPDLQGPLSLVSTIWGSDFYYALYDYPELVHNLLKLMTETYIKYMKELKKTIHDDDGAFVYHWGTLFKGRVVLRNDTAVTLSREMYEEFVKPYDQQIFDAFGGGSMHYCGRADQWLFSMMESAGLGALNFGQPPNLIFGMEFLAKIYPKAREKKIAIVDYIIPKETLPEIIDSQFQTGITYQVNVANQKEALELAQQLIKE